MGNIFDEDMAAMQVVVNDEAQYSIWPVGREVPAGWRSIGIEGPKKECLTRIDEIWTDMRPLSLRKAMDGTAEAGTVG